jgi:hypothetical protein
MMTAEDVELRVRQQTDPQMMAELGGPRPREAIERAHARSLALAAEGRCWPLKVVLDGAASPAGVVDVFESSHGGETFYEIGWMILPEFQGRGLPARPYGRSWGRRGRSGCSGRSTPFPRSRTGLPTRSARRTASRSWGARVRVRRTDPLLQPLADRPVLKPGAGCEDSACHQPTPSRTASGCRQHIQWQPGQAETAAEGGAGRRSAKNAAAPYGSIARSAPCDAAAPLPPRGGLVVGFSFTTLPPRGGMTSENSPSRRRGVRQSHA